MKAHTESISALVELAEQRPAAARTQLHPRHLSALPLHYPRLRQSLELSFCAMLRAGARTPSEEGADFFFSFFFFFVGFVNQYQGPKVTAATPAAPNISLMDDEQAENSAGAPERRLERMRHTAPCSCLWPALAASPQPAAGAPRSGRGWTCGCGGGVCGRRTGADSVQKKKPPSSSSLLSARHGHHASRGRL